ncbi:unnamed protein product [Adineta steineri]|uniref:GDP-fucose protein O-fucosyltransferase 1 n=1 Tax=Adineta steineri TaxID=433720 RepID=A0A819AR70_9BILA|nr:unnamed protein product [Adineta steineri]CAF3789363.1 unnamed protein product [Adineta steineri]
MSLFVFSIIASLLLISVVKTDEPQYEIDPNGYITFCLCMGRLGNQVEHFLGGLAFAKLLNRTLIVPPLRTNKNVPYSEWFQIESLRAYHRVIDAQDFMQELAPHVWPPESRIGFCWLPNNKPKSECKMKEGNPFGPFWNELHIDFVDTVVHNLNYDSNSIDQWKQLYSSDLYPVIALKGAPAPFPMKAQYRYLQKYMNWSNTIINEVQQHQQNLFNNTPYIGIHLRNDNDWKKACADVESYKSRSYMASPQCLDLPSSTHTYVTHKICYPSDNDILRLLKNIILRTRIHNIYVATDKRPMIKEIQEYLSAQRVHVKHLDPWLPIIDVAMLAHANYFIGNCVSSFTSFVKRARDVQNLPTAFWGFSN